MASQKKHSVTLRLNVERSTKRYHVYSVDPQGPIVQDTLYLHSEWLKQQFGGEAPNQLTITIGEI